jgi:hypothetical protein
MLKSLYFQVVFAVIIAIIFGHYFSEQATQMKLFGGVNATDDPTKSSATYRPMVQEFERLPHIIIRLR